VNIFSEVTFTCNAKGYPLPTINWILNNEAVWNDSNTIVNSSQKGAQDCSLDAFGNTCVSSSRLTIRRTLPFHTNTYSCMAMNAGGNDIRSFRLTVKGMR